MCIRDRSVSVTLSCNFRFKIKIVLLMVSERHPAKSCFGMMDGKSTKLTSGRDWLIQSGVFEINMHFTGNPSLEIMK